MNHGMNNVIRSEVLRLSRVARPVAALLLSGLMLTALLGSGPASAQSRQEWRELNQRLARMEEQLYNLRARLNTARTNFAASGASENPGSVAQVSVRMNSIEEQLRRMIGQVERIGHEVNTLKSRFNRFAEDTEFRFRDQDGGGNRVANRPAPSPRPLNPPAGSDPYAARPPSGGEPVYRDLNRAPPVNSLGRIPANGVGQDYAAAPPSGGPIRLAPGGLGTVAPGGAGAVRGDADLLYQRAYDDMLKRRFDAAEAGFKGFLRRHRAHELAGNAQYWLGETYYARGRYREAASAFIAGYREHGNSPKAPDSLLKLAITLNRLKQTSESCATLSQLKKQFPRASQAVRSRAEKERKRLRC